MAILEKEEKTKTKLSKFYHQLFGIKQINKRLQNNNNLKVTKRKLRHKNNFSQTHKIYKTLITKPLVIG